jgi:hypothetical protein
METSKIDIFKVVTYDLELQQIKNKPNDQETL